MSPWCGAAKMICMDQAELRIMKVSPEEGPAVYREICDELAYFWEQRDVRALHHPMWLRQFVGHAVTVRHRDLLVGYLLGALPSPEVAYTHLVATRAGYRGHGIGRSLYDHFLDEAADRGARAVEAITTPANVGSVAFHQRMGFQAETIIDYAGPGHDRVLFQLDLSTRNRKVDV